MIQRLARWFRARPELLVVAVAVIVAVPAMYTVVRAEHHRNGLRTADRLVLELEADEANVRALESSGQAANGLSPGLLLQGLQVNASLRQDVEELRRAKEGAAVVPAANAYFAAYMTLVRLGQSGNAPELRRVYRDEFKPAERRLRQVLATRGPLYASARARAQHSATVETLGVLIGGIFAMLLLALGATRVRAGRTLIAEAARAELAEQNLRLRESEQQMRKSDRSYRALVERLPGMAYISAASGVQTIYISPQIEAMLGYSQEEWEADPTLPAKVVHPDDRERVEAAARAFRARRGEESGEYRMVARDGRVLWVEDIAVFVLDDDGGPSHVQGYIRDITPLKVAEEERERMLRQEQAANERLRDLDRMKDEFVALVSHELRTPLTSIQGYLELMLEEETTGPLNPEQEQFLTVIERNARRLQQLVGDLLFMARLDANQLSIQTAPVDLSEVAGECVEAARPNAEANGVALASGIAAGVIVAGDRQRLGQLLDNLLSNAVKFTPRGGRVSIRVAPTADDAVIEVADSGIGIPEQQKSKLFERFFRTSNATELAIPGTGLGLAISNAIIEAHGGSIGFDSTEGRGTTFRITLPLSAASSLAA